jgi:DNA polymerase-1
MNNVQVGLVKKFPNARLLMQIHDELVVEARVHEAEEVKDFLVELMESAMDLDVPIVADASIGSSWAECK